MTGPYRSLTRSSGGNAPAIKEPAPREPGPPEFDFTGFSKKLKEFFMANGLLILQSNVVVSERANEINLDVRCRPTTGRVATSWNLTD